MKNKTEVRGISMETGRWVYGLLYSVSHYNSIKTYIQDGEYAFKNGSIYGWEVDPETIGRCMDFRNIYEGDIIRSYDSKGNAILHEIAYNEDKFGFDAKHVPYEKYSPYAGMSKKWINDFEKEVVGNIHENPELLEVEVLV